jgi:hypothetical protein
MLRRIWSTWNAPLLLVGMQDGATYVENSLVTSCVAEQTMTLQPSNPTPL